MCFQAILMSPIANVFNVVVWLYASAAAVVSVFKADEFADAKVLVVGHDQVLQLIYMQYSVIAGYCTCHETAQLGKRSLLIVVNMTTSFAYEFVPGLAMYAQRNLIGHRT